MVLDNDDDDDIIDEEVGGNGDGGGYEGLGEFLGAFLAGQGAQVRVGDGDEDGAGKREGTASEEEREGEAGERAGKKKRSGGTQRKYHSDITRE